MSVESLILFAAPACLIAAAALARTGAPQDARVSIISPRDGASVNSPVTVKFGLKGMGVAPAGVDRPNTGHHHLLINVADLPALDQPLPADDRHRQFGGGQTEAAVVLPPGKHTLRLLLGDHNHAPHDPPVMSESIVVFVE